MFFITLVSSDKPLLPAHIAGVESYIAKQGLGLCAAADWLAPQKAADLPVMTRPATAQIRALQTLLQRDKIDIFITAAAHRRKKLLLADMDSTIVDGEMLDDLAAHAGMKDKIAAITARAMAGKIDFEFALRERVAQLKGLSQAAIVETLTETRLNPGAQELCGTMRAQGALCALVSGGFTLFTGVIADRAGFDFHHGNTMDIINGKIAGTISGPVIDKTIKRALLVEYRNFMKIEAAQTLAIGDGANDLPMLQEAALGIGYHPKPLLREALDNCILYGDLTAALYAQGYRKTEFSS